VAAIGAASVAGVLAGAPSAGIATSAAAGSNGNGAANGAADGGPGIANGFGDWSWSGFVAASPAERERLRSYKLQPVYFRRDAFKTTADCMTAAYSQKLPLDVCR
jgi:hypothetical protein